MNRGLSTAVLLMGCSGAPATWLGTPRVPVDNPSSHAKAELGQHLFHDPRLSGSGEVSCATCHDPAHAFTDGLDVSVGAFDVRGVRNTPTLLGVGYAHTLGRGNPALTTLERHVHVPLFGENPIEMGITGHEDAVLAALNADPRYAELTAAAFDHADLDLQRIAHALATFQRTLISTDSAYDRFVYAGDLDALTPAQRRGMDLFFGRAGCVACHGGPHFTVAASGEDQPWVSGPFFNTGLYDIDGQGAYPPHGQGVWDVTGDAADQGAFKPPTLRNVALTAPYMHDGSLQTLEEVVETYARGGRQIPEGPHAGDGRDNPYKSTLITGFALSATERDELVAFLHALTDPDVLTDPRFIDPF